MSLLLIIQFSLMIGAIQAKDAADSAEVYLSQLLENSHETVSSQDSQQILDVVTSEFPVLGSYFGIANFSGHNTSELSAVMHETMLSYLHSYIWHRVWWILGIIIVACIIAVCFEEKEYTGSNLRDYPDITVYPEDNI